MSERVKILNGEFDPVTLDETIDKVIEHIRKGESGWLATVNVAILMTMREDPFLQDFVDRASFIVADGQPLIWVAPLLGQKLPERVTGVDLVTSLSSRCAKEEIGIYLLGAKDEIIQKVADRLRGEIPGLKICGVANGYFSAEEAPMRAKAIAKSGAEVLFVGMGVPRQEHFISAQLENSNIRLAIGVGGSFDVLAGLRTRAPKIVQTVGMEWAFRLVQEPKRLARRYAETNAQFLYHIASELLSKRK